MAESTVATQNGIGNAPYKSLRQGLSQALSLASGDLEAFIVRAHAAASDALKERFSKTAASKTAVDVRKCCEAICHLAVTRSSAAPYHP